MKKDIYPYGIYNQPDIPIFPCKKCCANCEHCDDVTWDFTNGPYMFHCDIQVDSDSIICKHYVNDGTEPVDIETFKKGMKLRNEYLKLLHEASDLTYDVLLGKVSNKTIAKAILLAKVTEAEEKTIDINNLLGTHFYTKEGK